MSSIELGMICQDLSIALYELHLHRISHMQIRPENIVFLGSKDRFVFRNFECAEEIDIKALPVSPQGNYQYRNASSLVRSKLYASPQLRKYLLSKRKSYDIDSCSSGDEYCKIKLKNKGDDISFDPFKNDIFSLGLVLLELSTLGAPYEPNDIKKLFKKCCVPELLQLAKRNPLFPLGDYYCKGNGFYKGINILLKMLCEDEAQRIDALDFCWLTGSEKVFLDMLKKPDGFAFRPTISTDELSSLDKLKFLKIPLQAEGDESFQDCTENKREGIGNIYWLNSKAEKIVLYEGEWLNGLPRGGGILKFLEKEVEGQFLAGRLFGNILIRFRGKLISQRDVHSNVDLESYLGEGIAIDRIECGRYELIDGISGLLCLVKKKVSV